MKQLCVRSRVAFLGLVLCLPTLLSYGVEPIRIATYNVHNYNLSGRRVEGVYRKNYPKPEASKAALRKVLMKANADVVALQEIGNDAYLEELQRDLKKDGLNYPYRALVEGPDQHRKVAVLSKQRWKHLVEKRALVFSYNGEPTPVKRGLLGVVFEDDAGEWAVFILHLKGKFTEYKADLLSRERRRKEAFAIRDWITHVFPPTHGARYVITGDWNDDPQSPSMRAFLKKGKANIGTLITPVDSRGERWTHYYANKDIYSRVDYFVASPEFAKNLKMQSSRILDLPEWNLASDHRLAYIEWSPESD